ncbi:unnamed protein product [Schistosoma mattheei]|uniref:Uncharacterized protein n=1 Tax=Schistosoma mattheei TaxID=31246 RepID=A0A183NQE9_9TREM|nr:unnamed protein product [Schistosoma mattheei]
MVNESTLNDCHKQVSLVLLLSSSSSQSSLFLSLPYGKSCSLTCSMNRYAEFVLNNKEQPIGE